MTEYFSAIKIEASISGSWVDLTPDVRISPPPSVTGIGYLSNGFADRVGDAGTLRFTLDNSNRNSASTLGYYTPQGENRLAGWGVGLQVRLYFEYDGYRRYKFNGYIDNDGIEVETGRYRGRAVTVTASNWLKWAADQSLALIQRQTNLRIDQAVYSVIENCNRKPLRVEYYQGDLTFPTVFDSMKPDTRAISELQKLSMSELGKIFIKCDESGGETLVVANKDWHTSWVSTASGGGSVPVKNSDITDDLLLEDGSFLLLENGDNLLLENSQSAAFYTGTPGAGTAVERDIIDVSVAYSKYLFNRAKLTTYPRTVDVSTVVLWSLDEPIEIAAGETIDNIRGSYKDPNNEAIEVNGFDMVVPVATTDYLMNSLEDGSGTNRTSDLVVSAEYGAAEVSYSLTNNNASTSFITFLQARGKGVYIRDKTEKVYNSASSQTSYGVQAVDFDFEYLSNMDDLFTFAPKSGGTMYDGGIFTNWDQPNMSAEVSVLVNNSSIAMMSFMFQEPGDRVYFYEHMTQSDGLGVDQWGAIYIRGYSFEIVDGRFVKWHVNCTTAEHGF